MSSTLYQPFNINGVISTDKSALQNLNDLCTAAGAFLTFDTSQGKWAVVINTTGSSIKSFNDSNIIGSINVTETGVAELYNSASLEFPHKDLRDETDFVEVTIPSGNRYPNEIDKTLLIQSNLINNPVQAQYIASIELKQSRLNKIISFSTDYTSLGLKAGDLIDVTAAMYGFSSKVFRVITLEENDDDILSLNITAQEYSADVYSSSGLVSVEKTKKTGIQLKQQNETLKELDDASVAGSLGRMLAANVGLGIVNSLLNKLFGRQQIGVDANGNPIYSRQIKPTDAAAADIDKILSSAKRPALTTISSGGTLCEGDSKTINVGHNCVVCLFDVVLDYPYTITGISAGDIDIPLTGNVTVDNGVGSLTFTAIGEFSSDESVIATIEIGGLTTNVAIWGLADFTLSATRNNASITEGGTVIVTLTATGSKANASIPYSITGTAIAKVSSPALTGNVSTSSGTATLTINTTDDSEFQGTQGLTISFGEDSPNPCAVTTTAVSVSVLDNDTAPPTPPTPPADTTCVYVVVPAVWCGQFDGTTGVLKGITTRKSVYLPVPQAGEASINVPLSCSVSGGAVSINSSVAVAASSVNAGGFPVRIITSFNAVPNRGIITGTTTTLYGYPAE